MKNIRRSTANKTNYDDHGMRLIKLMRNYRNVNRFEKRASKKVYKYI